MFDEKVVAYTGAEEHARERRMLIQRDARVLARVGEPGARVIVIGNRKRFQIDLKEEVCKGRVTASTTDCNIIGVRSGWSSFRARPLASL